MVSAHAYVFPFLPPPPLLYLLWISGMMCCPWGVLMNDGIQGGY